MARTDTLGHFLTDVADAIRTKSGSVSAIQASQFDTEIKNLPGGGSSEPIEEKDVNFYDYDGTLLHSYSANDFLELETLPPNPTHEHLISQGWNWSLEDAKTQVTSEGMVDIGQMYTTKNNSTNVYIKLVEGRLKPYLGIAVNGTVNVDWGDNSTPQDITGTSTSTIIFTQHTYSQPGDYVIKLTSENTFYIPGDSYGTLFITKNAQYHNNTNIYYDRVYASIIQKIELGTNVILNTYCFRLCVELKTLLIPVGIASTPYGMCWDCKSLQAIVLPNAISAERYLFAACASLGVAVIPKNITNIRANMFADCQTLQRIVIPYTTTIIDSGGFTNCPNLKIINIPSSISTIGNSAFSNCWCLRKFTCPSSLTELKSSVFQYCYSLSEIIISASVTSIYGTCFDNCRGVKTYDFSNHTSVPTLRNALGNQSEDYEILVPSDLYNDWIAASNWSSISSHIVAVESEE